MTDVPQRSFTTRLQVRFGHVDAAGIVYFPKIFDYIHEAFEELWDGHVGKRYHHVLGEERLGFPLVRSEVDFRSPLRFGDRPIVRVTVFKLGRSSIGLHYRFHLDDVLCVDARMTVVCVKLDGLVSTPVPPAYRVKFEEILEVA
jgi:4-hydroxybenzoyl-CoA thioesterase